MKFFLNVLTLCACLVALSSCFNTRMLVGNIESDEPMVEVSKEWNHGVLWGLVPLDNATMKVEEHTDGAPNYMIKTNQSFLNMVVYGITGGVYSPTQTTYYVPAKDVE